MFLSLAICTRIDISALVTLQQELSGKTSKHSIFRERITK